MSIAVVSSCYGGYDTPVAPVPQDTECEWLLVTDNPVACEPWRVVVEPRSQVHPRLAAKVAKCRPDFYTDHDVIIWVDASFRILAPDFVSWCVEQAGQGPVAQVRHSERSSIAAEAEASLPMAKYAGLPVREQAASYIKSGFPDGWGLWATGLIVYRHEVLPVFGARWLAEQLRWTYQDQVSEPPVLWSLGITPVDMAGPLYGNPRFTIRGHASHL